MSKFELLKQTLLGNLGAQIPFSVWKHHPEKDRTPEGLAEEEIAFHREFDHDLLKISFHGRYAVVDWGCLAVYDGAISGSTTCASCAVERASDWETLEPLDVNAGELGNQVRAVELVSKYTEGLVPTMATVFDTALIADKLCMGKFTDYIVDIPEIMHSTLDMITDVMIDFGRAVLDAGSDGIFIASQHSTHSAISERQYLEFVLPYDLKIIEKLRGKADFIALHLHAREKNEEIRFEKIAKTPGVDAINWEDQTAALSLREGKTISRKAVLGGIDHMGTLRTGTPDEVKEQIFDAAREAGLVKLMIAPGCVITVDTPRENIQAMADAVRSIDPFSDEWEAHS